MYCFAVICLVCDLVLIVGIVLFGLKYYVCVMKESQSLSMPYLVESQSFPLKQLCPEKPKVVNALQLFKLSHRATRPDHIVIILRRLPGSWF